MPNSPVFHVFLHRMDRIRCLCYHRRKSAPLCDETLDTGDFPARISPRFKREAPVRVILPRSCFIEKMLSLPSSDPEETGRIARLQAVKLVPYSLDEIVTYCREIRRRENGYTDLLLYVISREKLAGLLDPLLQSGFVPDALFISCLDVPIFLESPDAKPSVNRFVYRNGPFLEAGLFEGKRLCYSRAFECPAGSPAEARRWIEETFRYASEKTGIEPSADMYRVRDALEKDADTPGEEPPGGVPVSLSLAQTVRDPFPGPLPPPLALETVSRLRERRRFRTRALRFLWIVFVLGSVLTARLAWTRNRLSQKLAQIETEIRTIQHEAGEAAVLKQKRDIFLEHVSRNERILKALVELYAAIPAHARLSLLEVDGTGTVVIKGVAERGAMDMVETLEASPVFREVSLRYQNRRSREKGVEFQIAAELEDARIAETLPRKEPAP